MEISEPRDTKVRRKVPSTIARSEQTIDLPLEASSYKYILLGYSMITILVIWALGPDSPRVYEKTCRRKKSFFHESTA